MQGLELALSKKLPSGLEIGGSFNYQDAKYVSNGGSLTNSPHEAMILRQERLFLLDSQMRWEVEPKAFLARLSLVRGKTNSPRTWRSYAYQIADWLSFCERMGVEWRHATELNIATYRNILASESSSETGLPLKRSTINHKLTVICQFYRFAQKKGWIDALPFELEPARISYSAQGDLNPQVKPARGSPVGNSLKLREPREELQIPPRQEVRRFTKSFLSWRDRLIAEVMWLTGMRSSEVRSLPLNALPEDPTSLENDAVAIRIIGKGQKRRAVMFPVRLLRSIDRYIHMERRCRVSRFSVPLNLTSMSNCCGLKGAGSGSRST